MTLLLEYWIIASFLCLLYYANDYFNMLPLLDRLVPEYAYLFKNKKLLYFVLCFYCITIIVFSWAIFPYLLYKTIKDVIKSLNKW